MITREEALQYHREGRHGKIEVISTKPCQTQKDLSLAYTPGVAEPCLEIQRDPLLANLYTARGNLVAVITNGTAVLGLGNIGALAGKPVMEGKAILFKRFADVDVFDLELDTTDADRFIDAVKLMEPTFGGINLEDIAAPDCFYIEDRLKKEMNIPVFHDDQHGTAIISGAALINAVEIQQKDISTLTVVFSGAGAAAISCARHYIALGVQAQNLLLCDRKGVIWKGRPDIAGTNKEEFAIETSARTLADALKGADCFVGLSSAGVVSKEMVASMNKKPILFAMANPNPEIGYADAKEAAPDCIMATGRSDFPNQVNNVLGFPFIFRGALDVCATEINEEMKLAATHALASLTKEGTVPQEVCDAYAVDSLTFGSDYLIPKPLDPRVLVETSLAVAKAAVESGVARAPRNDWDVYRRELEVLAKKLQK